MSDRPASGPLNDILGQVAGTGNACTVGPFLETLTPERQQAIADALRLRTPLMAIGRACQTWGFEGGPSTIVRHLQGRCRCPR